MKKMLAMLHTSNEKVTEMTVTLGTSVGTPAPLIARTTSSTSDLDVVILLLLIFITFNGSKHPARHTSIKWYCCLFPSAQSMDHSILLTSHCFPCLRSIILGSPGIRTRYKYCGGLESGVWRSGTLVLVLQQTPVHRT